MASECSLETIKAGILDAMMRTTPVYNAYAAACMNAPKAFHPEAGTYVETVGGNACRVCALGSLLCTTLAKPTLSSPQRIQADVYADWNYVPAQLECFDAVTLAVLETIFEADSPIDRAGTDKYPKKEEIQAAWDRADSTGCGDSDDTLLLTGMARLDDTERLLAALQYLYEQDGKLIPEDICKFSQCKLTRRLVEDGGWAAEKAARLYLDGITNPADRIHAQQALQDNQNN